MITTMSILIVLAFAVFLFFLDIQVRAENDNEPFVLDDTAEVLNGITLAADQGDLTRGAVLGEVSATPGTYKLCDAKAADGSGFPKLILSTLDVACDGSPITDLSAYNAGLFDENQLVFGGDTDIDTKENVELMPNADDRNVTSDGAWANVDINAYAIDTDLTITANSDGQYCTLPVLSLPTEVGGAYRMFYDLANIVSSWTIQDFTGAQVLGTISANATQGTLSWVAQTTGGIRIVSVVNNSSGDFDNFKLQRSDVVADLSMRDALRMLNIRVTPGISVSGSENT